MMNDEEILKYRFLVSKMNNSQRKKELTECYSFYKILSALKRKRRAWKLKEKFI